MFNSDILEVAIGIIFVFILVSLICSAVREGIETWMKTRAAYLEHGIRELVRDPGGGGLASWLYDHPLISGLYPGYYSPPGARALADPNKPDRGATKTDADSQGGEQSDRPSTKTPNMFARGRNLPSYIPSRNFAMALMDLAARGPVSQFNSGAQAAELTPQTIRANIQNIESPAIQRVLLNALDSAQGDLERVRKELEGWYDSGMDRVSGWYKRSTQFILFAIGLGTAVALNVDAIHVANYLYRHPAARAAVVARAEEAAKNASTDPTHYEQARAALDSLKLPIGWDGITRETPFVDRRGTLGDHVLRLLGWLITGFAVTMGAPFWFDVLNKVMVIRSTVKPREKSPEEGSEDRQPKRARDLDPTPPPPPGPPQLNVAQPARAAAPTGDTPTPLDAESRLEGCGVEPETRTDDELLPQAEGGVAR
jgi:hypothetical protein